MPTAAQKRRLLEGIAFIRSHRRQWDQSYWINPDSLGKCGTVGCLAGHIAVTLNPSKPLVDVPASVWKKKPSERTEKEEIQVGEASRLSEYLRPVTADADNIEELSVRLTEKPERRNGVHVRARAARLIGVSNFSSLWGGDNKMRDIYAIAAAHLGMTVAEVKEAADKIAEAEGWTKQKTSA